MLLPNAYKKMKNKISSKVTLEKSRQLITATEFIYLTLITVFVFVRFFVADEIDFSYDYFAYIHFLRSLDNFSPMELINESTMLLPYIIIPGAALFEFGFVFLSKTFLIIFVEPKIAFAAMAATSVCIRIYVMRKLGAHWLWIILVSIYSITLFEANALRLGIASSLIIFGLYRLYGNHTFSAWTIMLLSISVHLQSLIFILPFMATWSIRNYMNQSQWKLFFITISMSLATIFFTTLLPQISNSKVEEYMNRGISNSAGLNITSSLALVFAVSALIPKQRLNKHLRERLIWVSIVSAALPSILLFITLTSIAVIGDRAWQLSFVIISTFLFTEWATKKSRIFSVSLLVVLTLVSVANITWRYPLSNFYDFILPHATIINNP